MQAYIGSKAGASPAWRRARMALVIGALAATAACGGGKDATGPDDSGLPRTDVPSSLAGDWFYGTISPTNFYDDHTGEYSGNAYGIGVYMQFAPNGTYKEYFYAYTQTYGCRTQVWTYMEGTVEVTSSSFTFYPSKGNYKVADTCVSGNNYTRNMTRDELVEKRGDSWQYYLDDSSGSARLYTGPGGPSEFRRPD